MKTDIHPLVQNSDDFDAGSVFPIINEVGSDCVFQISISNIDIPALHLIFSKGIENAQKFGVVVFGLFPRPRLDRV